MVQIAIPYQGIVSGQTVIDWFKEKKGESLPVPIDEFISIAEDCGVNWLGLFCMALVETGYFTSEIFKTKKNMFGLGAVDSDPLGGAASFQTYSNGIKAGAQHLAVYAGVSSFKKMPHYDFILQRTAKLRDWGYFGIVKDFNDLGGVDSRGRIKWASNPEHGKIVERLYFEIEAYAEEVTEAPPVLEKPPTKDNELMEKVIKLLRTIQPVLSKIHPWLGWFILILYSVLDIFF